MRQQKQENKRGNKVFFLLFFFLLSLAFSLLGVYCLNELNNKFVQSNFLLLSVVICACGVALFLFGVYIILYGKDALLKGTASVYFLVVFALIVCLILQKTNFFVLVDTPEKLQEYLQKTGVLMPIFYIILQFLQVVILPIPSIASTAAGVALFGAFWAMIYSLVGILSGSITAFLIGRKLGNKAVSWIVGEETLAKWQKKLKGKDKIFLSMMFVLPLFPDDILCFLAGLSTMTTRYFFVVVLLARFVGIFATCYSIDFIPFTTWWGITLWTILGISVVVLCIVIYKKIDAIQRFFKRISKKYGKNE